MADLMAIVSKAVFEKAAGKQPALGTLLAMDRYVSANKNLEPLAKGGKLYLVTVRPPDEALWLVAILDQPKHDGTAWVAKPSATPITDISHLRSEIAFTSGTGITAKAGALGMSLQTPRALTPADVALLDGAASGAPAPRAAPADTSGRAELLAAILADPDNDDARRIYGDLLAQQDDPRGELIVVELALAGPLSIRKRDQLALRRAALLKAHAKAWFPYKVGSVRTHHGFVQAVRATFDQLKTGGKQLFAAEPVIEVELAGVEEDTVEPLLAATWLPRLRRLILRGSVGDEGFAALCSSPATANLRALNVTANELTSEAFDGMAAGLPRCRSLVLTANLFGDDGLHALRRWKHVGELEMLYLSGCEISGDGLAKLLDGLTFTRLEKLCVADNDGLGDDGAATITAAAARLPVLRHLDLANTGLSDEGAQLLATASLPSLRRIDARRNDLDTRLATADARFRV